MGKIGLNHSNLIPLSLNEFVAREYSVGLTKRQRALHSAGVMGQTKETLLTFQALPRGVALRSRKSAPFGRSRVAEHSCRWLKAPLPGSDSRMSVSKFNLNWLNKGWQRFCFMDGSTSVALVALLSEIKFFPSPLRLLGCFQLDRSHSSSQSIKPGFATVSESQPQQSCYGSLVLGQEASEGARHQVA